MIAMPKLNKKMKGITVDSTVHSRIINIEMAAINIYIGISVSNRFFVSSSIPLIPLRKACFDAIFLIDSTAFKLFSAPVPSANLIKSIVELSPL